VRRVVVVIAIIAAVIAPTALAGDTARLQVALKDIKQSTLAEQNALVALGKKPIDWHQIQQDAFTGDIIAGSAHVQLSLAVNDGEVGASDITGIGSELIEVGQLDHQAYQAAEKKDAAHVAELIRKALPLKHSAQSKIETLISGASVKRCEVEKPFQVFAIPSGFSGSYADVYPHGIPKGAKNVKASFIDLATGKAPGPDVFPGQTWTSTVKGFLPDGRFDVHVDVTGTGFGKPDANVKNWKVVVTYDCP